MSNLMRQTTGKNITPIESCIPFPENEQLKVTTCPETGVIMIYTLDEKFIGELTRHDSFDLALETLQHIPR
jgi:hypothetical protein